MKKQLNIALLPAAVAAALLSGNVMAGTESCFENWAETSADWTAAATGASYAETKYALANCKAGTAAGDFASFKTQIDGGVASAAKTLISDSVSGERADNRENFYIAREVSKDFAADGTSDGTEEVNLTYIPTTDIPGGSYITMEIANADFGLDNNDQIFLLGWDGSAYEVLATTDGVVNNQSKITFISQSGSPIGAGTRMIMSKNNTLPEPISFRVKNTDCSLERKDITLTTTDVSTAGGQKITGGIGATAILASIVPQFVVTETKAKDKVDAADEALSRLTFVDGYASDALFSFAAITDANDNGLDSDDSFLASIPMYGINTADAKVLWSATSTSNPGSTVNYFVSTNGDSSGMIDVKGDGKYLALDGTEYTLDESKITNLLNGFTSFKTVLENKVTGSDTLTPMNFNYDVEATYQMTFTGSPTLGAYLDGCAIPTTTHNIGVNGAVLKVPYMRMSGKDQFVKITNESNKEASILLDIFNDSASQDEANGVALGQIAAKETKLFYGQDLMAKAAAAGYTATDEKNHTVTFVVTAPESSVHGVSTQKVPGQSDRVQPVLRSTKEVTNFDQTSGDVTTEQAAWKW